MTAIPRVLLCTIAVVLLTTIATRPVHADGESVIRWPIDVVVTPTGAWLCKADFLWENTVPSWAPAPPNPWVSMPNPFMLPEPGIPAPTVRPWLVPRPGVRRMICRPLGYQPRANPVWP